MLWVWSVGVVHFSGSINYHSNATGSALVTIITIKTSVYIDLLSPQLFPVISMLVAISS